MARKNKDTKISIFRILLTDDQTHKQLWDFRFSRTTLFVTIITVICVVFAGIFSIIAFTPVRTFIPGYPDANTKREAIRNAIKVDSLETVLHKWAFYAENLRRVVEGEDPVAIDSLVRNYSADTVKNLSSENLRGRDSLLRQTVRDAEEFVLEQARNRNLPIEAKHFFAPLKGVVSQRYDDILHPYVDITAPANSVVMAVLDGTVISSGWSDDGGYTMAIQHADDIVSIYMHNQKLLKKTGDKVTAGSPVALVGSTGSISGGDHLHFELWHKGESVDPVKYISF